MRAAFRPGEAATSVPENTFQSAVTALSFTGATAIAIEATANDSFALFSEKGFAFLRLTSNIRRCEIPFSPAKPHHSSGSRHRVLLCI